MAMAAFRIINSPEWGMIESVLLANSPMYVDARPATNDEVVRAYEREAGYRSAFSMIRQLAVVIGPSVEAESTYEDPVQRETESKES